MRFTTIIVFKLKDTQKGTFKLLHWMPHNHKNPTKKKMEIGGGPNKEIKEDLSILNEIKPTLIFLTRHKRRKRAGKSHAKKNRAVGLKVLHLLLGHVWQRH